MIRDVLGSGTYTATISEWSGRILWQATDAAIGAVSWSRERNAMTKASMTAQIRGDIADLIEPWVHLLTIYRDGELVWHGVVMKVAATSTQVKMEAADGSVFFSYRRVASNRTWAQHDATQVMRTMVEDALGYADSTGIVESITTHESRLWITAGWTAAECLIDDVVKALEDQGLAWTVAAGRLLIGPVAAQHTTSQITDSHFDGQITITKDGAEVVTDALVVGKGVWGQHTAGDSPVGLLQSIEKADGLVRAEECEQLAARIVADARVAPRRVEIPAGSRLLPTAPIPMGDLIPGVHVPVATRQTGVLVGSMMTLGKVDVSADSGGETVTVTLSETAVSEEVAGLPDPADLDWRSPYEREIAGVQGTGTGSGVPVSEGQDEVMVPPV